MNWNEKDKTFTISDRKGDFPGMLKDLSFQVVWITDKNGTGVEPAKKAVTVNYSGKEVRIEK